MTACNAIDKSKKSSEHNHSNSGNHSRRNDANCRTEQEDVSVCVCTYLGMFEKPHYSVPIAQLRDKRQQDSGRLS